MKRVFVLVIFLLSLFSSNSFANLQFKQSKDISGDTSRLRGIFIKPDGTRLYVTEDRDTSQQNVIEYTLTTPFDVTTASNPKKTLLAVTEGGLVSVIDNPHAIEFKPDGTEMYIIRSDGSTRVSIEQFRLSTPWDTTTISWSTFLNIKTGCFSSIQQRGLDFKPDGTRVFVASQGNKKVGQYDLTTPWDISTATNQVCSSFDEEQVRNIQLSADGYTLYLGGNEDDDIKRYSLAAPYDITSITLQATTFSVSSQTGTMRGFHFSSNFTKLYVTGDTLDTIYEYDVDCAGTITCLDASTNDDVKAIIEANVESAKRLIRNNTLPIFHRTEWLRRHKNKDNLTNLNAELDFTNKKIAKLVNTLETFKKEKDITYNSDDWFQWSEGRVSFGKKDANNASSRDIHSHGISIGADKIKKDNRDVMYGYVFQYGNENIGIGSRGTNLDTDSYSLALYGTKIGENDYFTDGIIGLNLLDIDHKRVINGNTLKGVRDGQQIFSSINFGKRLHEEEINFNPGIKLDLGYTRLEAFREKTTLGNNLSDSLIYRDQNIKTALATIGVLFDTTEKEEEKIINHHGRLEYVGDLSPSSKAEFYYVNSQSTIYEYKANNKSKHNYRIGYGFDITTINGWSIVTNLERFGASGKGYYNELYLSVGYVPIDEMKFSFEIDNSDKTKLEFANKINEYDLKINSNYNLFSNTTDHSTNIYISNNF